MRPILLKSLIFTLTGVTAVMAGSDEILFRKHTVDLGRNEACAVADLNGDGKLDIVSGENWYEAPTWRKHKFRSFLFWNNYIDDFSDLPLDVNGDGALDIISVGWASQEIAWFQNPGAPQSAWQKHLIDSGSPVEFAFLVECWLGFPGDRVVPEPRRTPECLAEAPD